MKFEKGCLIIEPVDLELIQGDVKKGIPIKKAFEDRIFSLKVSMDDIYEIQASANNLTPYEELILSIMELF